MDLFLLFKIFILSFIQGVSEFFPISSSGHLVVFQSLLRFDTIPLVYDIFFHLGTLLSVIVFFFRDLWEIATGLNKKENREFVLLIIIASIPTAIIGFLFKESFEEMFGRPELVGYFFLITAIIIFLSGMIKVKNVNVYAVAFIIGTMQGAAIIPGLSRSGLTISAALILSMGFAFSFRFSFILSIPAIIGALILEAGKIPFKEFQIVYLIAGLIFSALFGFVALTILKKIILRKKFHYFAYYCIAAGVAAILIFS